MLKRKAERASAAESEQFARAEAAKPQGADGAISCAAHEPYPESIITADFLQWAPAYDGPRFNLIHCDFPYGIGADEMQQGGSTHVHGSYDDSEKPTGVLSLVLPITSTALPLSLVIWSFGSR
jgi:hypothetical protein